MEWLSLISPSEIIKAGTGWFKRPRPTINFEYKLGTPENDYCHYRVDSNTHRNCLFFRLGINNNGKKRIEEADVRVEQIEMINSKGERHKVSSSPFFLHWANENTDNSRTIYPDTPVYVDLLFTDEGRYGMAFLFPKSKHGSSGIREHLTPGKWIITVKLLGKDITPLKKEVSVDFNGKWDQIRLELL